MSGRDLLKTVLKTIGIYAGIILGSSFVFAALVWLFLDSSFVNAFIATAKIATIFVLSVLFVLLGISWGSALIAEESFLKKCAGWFLIAIASGYGLVLVGYVINKVYISEDCYGSLRYC